MAPANLFRSIVFRRTLAVVLLLTGVAATVIGIVGWQANGILTRAAEQAIETDVAELKSELVGRGFEALVHAVAERSRGGGSGVYYLADASGKQRAGNLARLPEWQGAAGRGLFRYARAEAGASRQRTAAGLLVAIDGEPRLVVGRDIEEQRQLLLAIYRSVGLGAALLALIGLGGSILLSRLILVRIEAMSGASAGIMASATLAGRIPVEGSGDELDRLALQLNEMLARIEQLMAGLREVSDNIAHDLKTPLNRLRNRAEAALTERGPDAWRQGLERVIDEADELIKTFNALLLIARLEAGSTMEGFELLDLAGLVRDVAELYEPVAEEAGFGLACTAEGLIVVRANRQLVGQALANLIDNALKYSAGAPGARDIAVSVTATGSVARLAVADRGPGIPPEHRERALKRFVRLEQSRSLPGTGLGLSLVAAVARLHGGTVALEDHAPGLRVVLELPLAAGAPGVPSSGRTAGRDMETLRG